MEKYLRLLNPKTTNFDAIGGGQASITAEDVLIAMSYVQLTTFQDNLIRLKYFRANTQSNVKGFSHLLVKVYSEYFSNTELSEDYQYAIVLVALTEFCLVTGNYKASENSRAIICGWSKSVVHKHLKKHIDFILSNLNEEFKDASEKVFFQLNEIK